MLGHFDALVWFMAASDDKGIFPFFETSFSEFILQKCLPKKSVPIKGVAKQGPASSSGRAFTYKSSDPSSIQAELPLQWQKMCNLEFSDN